MPRTPWQATNGLRDRQIPPYNALFDPSCDIVRSAKFQASLIDPLMPGNRGMGRSRSQHVLPSWAPLDMPNLELAALRAIDAREARLSRLHALLLQGLEALPEDPARQAAGLAKLRSELADEIQELRLMGMEVIEAVVRWRRRRRRKLEPFVWRSHNYLLKMLLDVFFLGLHETVADAVQDPFLLTCFEVSANAAPRVPRTDSSASIQDGGSAAAARLEEARPSALDDVGASPNTSPPGTSGQRMSAMAETPAKFAGGRGGGSRRRQLALATLFTPSRRHTKHEIVRMWAAERILEAERLEIGAAFAPISPVMQSIDLQLRGNAALFFFGKGEPPELLALAPTLPTIQSRFAAKTPGPHDKPERDPAMKPPPPNRNRDGKIKGGALAPLGSYGASQPKPQTPLGTVAPLSPPVKGSGSGKHKELPGLSPPPFVPMADPLSRPRAVSLGQVEGSSSEAAAEFFAPNPAKKKSAVFAPGQ